MPLPRSWSSFLLCFEFAGEENEKKNFLSSSEANVGRGLLVSGEFPDDEDLLFFATTVDFFSSQMGGTTSASEDTPWVEGRLTLGRRFSGTLLGNDADGRDEAEEEEEARRTTSSFDCAVEEDGVTDGETVVCGDSTCSETGRLFSKAEGSWEKQEEILSFLLLGVLKRRRFDEAPWVLSKREKEDRGG